MKLTFEGQQVDVFSVVPRTSDQPLYWSQIQTITHLSEKYECTGVLIFTGNDVYIDPWILAHYMITQTKKLCPLIAVNPIYMHPFSAAKMISSFAYMYERRVYLNLVTGTAVSYLEALGDELSHDERYERLKEYADIIMLLLAGSGLVSFAGRYYELSNLLLLPKVPHSLLPGLFISGQSESAQKVCASVGGIGMQMLKPGLALAIGAQEGIHFGLITRDNDDEAWQAAKRHFPDDPGGREVLDFSMSNTDSVWKRNLKNTAEGVETAPPNYWMSPFLNMQADCPYVVGDYEYVANLLTTLVKSGIRAFVLDIPADEEEFRHVRITFDLVAKHLSPHENTREATPISSLCPSYAGSRTLPLQTADQQ